MSTDVSAVPYPRAVADLPKVRQSILSDFDNCALSAHFELEHGGFDSHPAARGTIVHRVIARCLSMLESGDDSGPRDFEPTAEDRALQRADRVPVDVALSVLDELLAQHDEPLEPEGFAHGVTNLPLREVAQARVSLKAWASWCRFTPENFAGIERRLEAVLRYPNRETGEAVERVVSGQLDLLLLEEAGEHAIVVDWKDTFAIPSMGLPDDAIDQFGQSIARDDAVSQEGYFQQRFYAMLVFLFYPRVQRVTLREFYPRYAKGTVPDPLTGRPISPVREATVHRIVMAEIVAEMAALLERFDRAYERDVWRPSPGSHCYYCLNPSGCPIFPAARREGRLSGMTREDAEALAGRVQVRAAALRQDRAALRAWGEAFGEVAVRDAKRPRVFGPVVRQKELKPTAAQVREALARGQNPAELYRTVEEVRWTVHAPDEEHPFAAAARVEEEMLLAAERAAEDRRQRRNGAA